MTSFYLYDMHDVTQLKIKYDIILSEWNADVIGINLKYDIILS